MKFTEFESLMFDKGIVTLAEIARKLKTTPQAVSNWKARDQVPFHIINKLNKRSKEPSSVAMNEKFMDFEENKLSFSDILLILSEQLKVILLILFISIFFTFTFTKFVKKPLYKSWATVLFPENTSNNSGLSGIASQFGVSLPQASTTDLSNPTLFPDLLRSRTFAEKILEEKFYSYKYKKSMSLLSLLTGGDPDEELNKEILISQAMGNFSDMVKIKKSPSSAFSEIEVISENPNLSKNLADAVVEQLEQLNRFFKRQSTSEKTLFIELRTEAVKSDLEKSEQALKSFREKNRQASSPSLKLALDRLNREVEVQKGIFLTLKQQLELSKIEEVQESSVFQVLDKPQVPLGPYNISLKRSLILSVIFGISFGIIIGFLRSYINNNDVGERRKLRKVRGYIKRKSVDIILDKRISAIVSTLLVIGLPFYLGHKSDNPTYFNMYSSKLMIVNFLYVLTLIFSISLYFYNNNKNN